VEEVATDLSALTAADAAFISNTRLGVWPIASLAPLNKQFSSEHPLIRELSQRLDADRTEYVAAHRAQWVRA
jgi:branched-subunit amino acid aminotransferase/4-amino-4-deoxychorismate lyase